MARMLMEDGWEVYFAFMGSNAEYHAPMAAYWGERLFYLPPPKPDRRLLSRIVRKVKGLMQIDSVLRRLIHKGKYGVDDLFTSYQQAFVQEIATRNRFNVVIAEYVTMSGALLCFGPATHKMIDTHDVLSNRDQKFTQKGVRAKNVFALSLNEEKKGLDRADTVIAIQDQERRFFEELTSKKVITVGHAVELKPLATERRERKKLLFLGSRHEANVLSIQEFDEKVMPLLRDTLPDIKLLVAGKVCEKVKNLRYGKMMGEIDDLQVLYGQTDVVINPVLMGTGLKIKNIEALGYAMPLVTTTVGAEGLEAGIGKAFLAADTPAEFARCICLLFSDQSLYRSVSASAYAFAEQYNKGAYEELNQELNSLSE